MFVAKLHDTHCSLTDSQTAVDAPLQNNCNKAVINDLNKHSFIKEEQIKLEPELSTNVFIKNGIFEENYKIDQVYIKEELFEENEHAKLEQQLNTEFIIKNENNLEN